MWSGKNQEKPGNLKLPDHYRHLELSQEPFELSQKQGGRQSQG